MTDHLLTESEKQRILKRLKKILALAESSEPGEAAAALHQARVLMGKYGLEMADAHESSIGEAKIVTSSVELSRWENALAGVIGSALGVSIMVQRYKAQKGFKRPKASIIFVAEAHKVELAKYAYETLRRKLLAAVKQSFEQMLISAGVPRNALRINSSQRDAYAIAWCGAIREKVAALAPEVPPEVQDYMDKRITSDAKGSKKRTTGGKTSPLGDDLLANFMFHQGVKDGEAVELHKAVGGSVQAVLHLTT